MDARRREAHRRELERLETARRDANDTANSFWEQAVDGSDRAHEEVAREGAKAAAAVKDAADKVGKEVKEIVEDIKKDPQIVLDTITGTGKDIYNGTREAISTGVDVAKDIITHPIDIGWRTLADTTIDVKDLSVKLGKDIYSTLRDPEKLKNFLVSASGYENFKASWDPNKPLGTRLLNAGIGIYKVGRLIYVPNSVTELGTLRTVLNEGVRTYTGYKVGEAIHTIEQLKQAHDQFVQMTGIDLGKSVNVGGLDTAYNVIKTLYGK